MLFKLNQDSSKSSSFTVSPFVLILLTSVFITLTANLSFYQKLSQAYTPADHMLFIGCLFGIVTALNILLIEILWLLLPLKWAINSVLVFSVFCAYFADQFGVVIDVEMIRNSMQTNLAEASDLLTSNLIWRVLLLAICPVVLVSLIKLPVRIQPVRWKTRLKTPLALSALALLMIVVGIGADSAQFSAFIRQHKPLRYYINPIQPLFSGVKFYAAQLKSTKDQPFTLLADYSLTPEEDPNRELVIMVVGETARADHFSLNGYQRDTNPRLSQEQNLIYYPKISSCGTSTAISVPCMFSLSGRDEFDVEQARNTENAFDIIAKADVSVLWRDNNSDSKGVAVRQRFENFRSDKTNKQCDTECRDVGMLDGLQSFIDHQDHDVLIVLHQMGSHGPAYYKRYPAEFEQFKPACQTAELSQCSDEEIINAYDNSILYTDYFLSQVIALLKTNSRKFQTTMLYVSDHGESLGENGVYLHGLPYAFAPQTQIHVPIIVWTDKASDVDIGATRAQSQQANSHDAVSGTLISLFEIETDVPLAPTPDLLKFKH